jgi:dolichyl-diphosphooligosaccharide--protein glycosyltransferase
MSDPDAPADVLDERPDLEAPLKAILAVDEEEDSWTFDDIPVNSGPFGELVGRGVVESTGNEYRLADPDAVRTALATEGQSTPGESGNQPTPDLPSSIRPAVDLTSALFVTAAVAFVGLVRIHPIDAIYRGGDIVLSGNDPYAYRHDVEQMLQGGGVSDGAGLPIGPYGSAHAASLS